MSGVEWWADWRSQLAACGLDSWEALWNAEGELVDTPNTHRRGRSWVTRLTIQARPNPTVLYLKRQVNWTTRRWSRVMLKVPLAGHEWTYHLRCQDAGLPVPEPVCFAARRQNGELRSLIATAEIPQALPLDAWIGARHAPESGDPALVLSQREWWQAIRQAGATLRSFHRRGIRHGSLYPKHLYLSKPLGVPVVLMDLERMRWLPILGRRFLRDLESMHRRTPQASSTERLRFLLGWQGIPEANAASRKLWAMVQRRAARKLKV